MSEIYACILIGIDTYGDNIIKRFINEDKDYLYGYLDTKEINYSDSFLFKYYTSRKKVNINLERKVYEYIDYIYYRTRIQ